MRVIVSVEVYASPEAWAPELRQEIANAYIPTPEEPQPDDEWLAEEFAIRKFEGLEHVGYIHVTEVDNA